MPEVLLRAGPQGAGEALQGMWLLLTPSGAWNTAVLWLQQDQHSCQPAQQHLPQALWPPRCGCTGCREPSSLPSHPAEASRAVKSPRSFRANSSNSKSKHSLSEMLLKVPKKALWVNVSKLPQNSFKNLCVFS